MEWCVVPAAGHPYPNHGHTRRPIFNMSYGQQHRLLTLLLFLYLLLLAFLNSLVLFLFGKKLNLLGAVVPCFPTRCLRLDSKEKKISALQS